MATDHDMFEQGKTSGEFGAIQAVSDLCARKPNATALEIQAILKKALEAPAGSSVRKLRAA